MANSKDKDPRPLPLPMLLMSNVPVIPLLVTEILNRIDQRNSQIQKDQRFLLWATEAIKVLTCIYTLTNSPDLVAPAAIYLGSSFVQALTINKIIDLDRI